MSSKEEIAQRLLDRCASIESSRKKIDDAVQNGMPDGDFSAANYREQIEQCRRALITSQENGRLKQEKYETTIALLKQEIEKLQADLNGMKNSKKQLGGDAVTLQLELKKALDWANKANQHASSVNQENQRLKQMILSMKNGETNVNVETHTHTHTHTHEGNNQVVPSSPSVPMTPKVNVNGESPSQQRSGTTPDSENKARRAFRNLGERLSASFRRLPDEQQGASANPGGRVNRLNRLRAVNSPPSTTTTAPSGDANANPENRASRALKKISSSFKKQDEDQNQTEDEISKQIASLAAENKNKSNEQNSDVEVLDSYESPKNSNNKNKNNNKARKQKHKAEEENIDFDNAADSSELFDDEPEKDERPIVAVTPTIVDLPPKRENVTNESKSTVEDAEKDETPNSDLNAAFNDEAEVDNLDTTNQPESLSEDITTTAPTETETETETENSNENENENGNENETTESESNIEDSEKNEESEAEAFVEINDEKEEPTDSSPAFVSIESPVNEEQPVVNESSGAVAVAADTKDVDETVPNESEEISN